MITNKFRTISLVVAFIFLLAIGGSAQATRFLPVKAGDTAPDFTLSSSDGTKVTLSEAVKDAPVVLVFYRGYWCPFCIAQLRELLAESEKTRLFAVSIDPSATTNKLIQFVESKDKIKFKYSFLSDPKAKTIDAYGIRDPEFKGQEFDGIPYPTVYVIGANRKVIWSKLEKDFKKRPTNAEIRAALNKASADVKME